MFANYHCHIALDPDEWPGSWEKPLERFFTLLQCKMKYTEGRKEIFSIPIFEDKGGDFIDYLDIVYEEGV